MSTRPPIITILGHVDHGKTSLLDAIRHTSVTASETGGITQHIGAYQVEHDGKLLTFIDTPGHAAFSAMRSRGGHIADIAVLVVAADDGVKPQTKESIAHIKDAGIPYLVAITKSDLPEANPTKVKTELTQESVLVEGFGGNTPVVEVSAKSGLNLDLFLQTLLLMADLENLKSEPDGPLEAIIIEANLDTHKGPLVSLIVKQGTLKVGDSLTTTHVPPITGKARSFSDWKGNLLKVATPSTPVQLTGFDAVPSVGDIITTTGNLVAITTKSLSVAPDSELVATEAKLTIILRSDVTGTLEAILSSLPPEIQVLNSQTGPVTESDILLADTSAASIIAFRVPVTTSAQKLAAIEHVPIHFFGTIYDLLEGIPQLVEASEAAKIITLDLGDAKVIKAFDINGQKIIGATVTSGSLSVGDSLRLVKGDQAYGEATITSLRIGRAIQERIKKGQECGIVTDTDLPASAGDVLHAFKLTNR